MPTKVEPAVLSTRETWEYVGGRPFFELLAKDYPKILVPIRRLASGKTQYLRKSVDTALSAALLEQRYCN
jgi:hypothetical protein